jgi:bacterioferritin-associated ferredoxin
LAGSGGNARLARWLCALAYTAAELRIWQQRFAVPTGVARDCGTCRPQLRRKLYDKTGIFLRRQRTVRFARQQTDAGDGAG